MAGSKQVSPGVAVIVIVILIIAILLAYKTMGGGVKKLDDAGGLPPFAQKGGSVPPIAQKSPGGLILNPQAQAGGAGTQTAPGGGQ